MQLTHRSYAEAAGDFTHLCRLLVEVRRDEAWTSSTWCLGRIVDWKYGLWPSKLAVANFWSQNAQLWFDGFDDLVGLAIAENGDAQVAIITTVGYQFLFPEILDWVLDAWADRGPRFAFEVTEQQPLAIRSLEQRGFQRGAPFTIQRFDLTRLTEQRFPLAPGFTIVDMQPCGNFCPRCTRAGSIVATWHPAGAHPQHQRTAPRATCGGCRLAVSAISYREGSYVMARPAHALASRPRISAPYQMAPLADVYQM